MAYWDQIGVPHKGWICIEMIDLGSGLDDLDAVERKEYYETCQMCNQEGIRFVHVMEHPNYSEQLRVGYKCAEKMEEDYLNPKNRENELRNKHNRRLNFLKKDWVCNNKGNYFLKYKGHNITIMPNKFKPNGYGVIFNNKATWNYKGDKIRSFSEAQLVAFDLVDEYIVEHKNDLFY